MISFDDAVSSSLGRGRLARDGVNHAMAVAANDSAIGGLPMAAAMLLMHRGHVGSMGLAALQQHGKQQPFDLFPTATIATNGLFLTILLLFQNSNLHIIVQFLVL